MSRIYESGLLRTTEHWTPENLAWLAGIIEGEGSIEYGAGSRGNYYKVTVEMTDLDVVDRVHRIAGCGTLRGPYWHPKSTKEIWKWAVQNRPAVLALLQVIYPLMGIRRQTKIEDLMSWSDVGFT